VSEDRDRHYQTVYAGCDTLCVAADNRRYNFHKCAPFLRQKRLQFAKLFGESSIAECSRFSSDYGEDRVSVSPCSTDPVRQRVDGGAPNQSADNSAGSITQQSE
jgi:hypothetical protein